MHLQKLLGELQFYFLRKYIVPAAKRVGADLLEIAVPENAEVVTRLKENQASCKESGKTDLEKTVG